MTGRRRVASGLRCKVLDTQVSLRHRSPMSLPPVRPKRSLQDREPLAMHERAEADLAFVRAAVERSSQFTAVPGVGGVLMGVSAIIAALIAHQQPSNERWLITWIIDAAVAGVVGGIALVRKARRRQVPLAVGPARRFALGLAPALIAGAALTMGALDARAWQLLPPTWMLCYGVAVLGAGAASAAPIVPIVGSVFVVAGVLSIATPHAFADYWMAATFGIAHIVAGVIVARRHGG